MARGQDKALAVFGGGHQAGIDTDITRGVSAA